MSNNNSNGQKTDETLQIKRPGRLELTKTVEGGKVKQNFTHGRSKTVTVEVRKTRTFASNDSGKLVEVKKGLGTTDGRGTTPAGDDFLTQGERETRMRALKSAEEAQKNPKPEFKAPGEASPEGAEEAKTSATDKAKKLDIVRPPRTMDAAEDDSRDRRGAAKARVVREEPRRNSGKITVSQAMSVADERMRSLSSIRRQREKAKRGDSKPASQEKVFREVIIPEAITVQELANRMTERAVDVVKSLMKMGTMVTVTQTIDADTAELIVTEFGHKVKRVTDSDIENVLIVEDDKAETLESRPPVVTIMGHVDHGKTSLLDALRKTDVVAGEAGGITQHIGAYQVELKSGDKITFLDTPGHEAFTAMRARGAKVTDIVVLVVAADDGIMEQTKEAISHAKIAKVPIIVAVNKIDKPGADAQRVKTELMSYELVPEEFGGETQVIEVSAKVGTGLDKLEEAILLQAEVLELKANPNRAATGAVVEAKIDRGRGVVATILVQKGQLRVGDILVAGASWGKVRAIQDDKGRTIEVAGPSMPVEVLGLDHTPEAGDECAVVESEKTARDITEYRGKLLRERQAPVLVRSLESYFGTGVKAQEFNVIVKTDVHGSAEAIASSLTKLSSDEVTIRMIHTGVGPINESDITLAQATKSIVIGFNVRASVKAKELAAREKIDLRYYSIIYNVVEDVKAAASGLLAPTLKENIIGYAEIRQVFDLSKFGKVAGCMVTEGLIKRTAKARLLRDNVVIHTGALKALKRFKEDAKEVKSGTECGISFENYEDVRVGDMIEAFEIEEIARTI